MTHVYFDRVRETSVATGTGDFQLAGAVSGYRAFSDVMADGDTTDIEIVMGSAFESVRVRYNSGTNTLTRQFVYESSNSGSLVSFGPGTKDVFLTLPAKVAQLLLRHEITMAQTQMVLARLDGVAQFSGDAGNRFADSFAALTYVDTAGATALDSSIAGLLKPTASSGADQTNAGVGTYIESGHLDFSHTGSSAFDNSTSTAWYAQSVAAGAVSGVTWVGWDFGSGQTRTIKTVTIRQDCEIASNCDPLPRLKHLIDYS